jgi:hypothetical protein
VGTLNRVEEVLKELKKPYKMVNNGLRVYTTIINKKVCEVADMNGIIFVKFTLTNDKSLRFDNKKQFKEWASNGTL